MTSAKIKASNSKSRLNKFTAFDYVNTLILLVILIVILYPLYFTVLASFSDPQDVAAGKVTWWVSRFTTEAYQHIFEYQPLWRGYLNTIYYTVAGTAFALFLTIPAAYALSKKDLPHRKFVTTYFLITMFFGGGLVPGYLLVKELGLLNTRTILIISGGFSVYNMVVTRTFFTTTIPNDLYEAAEIDSATELKKFTAIALPLSKPIIAVMGLFYAVGKWNSYFEAMIYTSNDALETLQLVLRRILIMNQSAMSEAILTMQTTGDQSGLADAIRRQQLAYSMKYAIVFIGSLPLLIAYPFIQKYFVKGVMIGSIKG